MFGIAPLKRYYISQLALLLCVFLAITRDPVHAFNRHSVGVMVCERITSVNMPTIQRA